MDWFTPFLTPWFREHREFLLIKVCLSLELLLRRREVKCMKQEGTRRRPHEDGKCTILWNGYSNGATIFHFLEHRNQPSQMQLNWFSPSFVIPTKWQKKSTFYSLVWAQHAPLHEKWKIPLVLLLVVLLCFCSVFPPLTYRSCFSVLSYCCQEAPCGDLVTHVFCHLCAICQEHREIRERSGNSNPSNLKLSVVTPPPVQTMEPVAED